jgi:tetratricopeptide (TPR) repeat protein
MRWFLMFCLLAVAAPAAAQPRPDARKAEIDALIGALAQAPDEAQAGMIEMRLRQLWLQAGTPVTTMLMGSGLNALRRDSAKDALDDFNAALALAPNLADAFQQRALARFALGDYRGAVADIEATLQREPRDFAAFETLSRIAEAQGDARGALAAWRRAMAISPKTPGGAARLQSLIRKADGEAT